MIPQPIGSGDHILLTGGTGTLGTELRQLLPGIVAPGRDELDVLDEASIASVLRESGVTLLVHAAAYTDVSAAETSRPDCWATNVEGTCNVARAAAAAGVFLVHISTDYVFDGRHGGYKEDDVLGPPLNYYALTKIVAEALVRMSPDHLIVRTSFRPRQWQYPHAFTDMFTSQDYVDVVAPSIAQAITCSPHLDWKTVHIATERKSVYDLARRRSVEVGPGSKRDVNVLLPDDISLDTSRWKAYCEGR